MTTNDIVGLILSGFVCLLFLVIGILLLNGKCSFLIAGYNTLSKAEKEKHDEKALCRFIGKLMIAIFFCVLFLYAGVFFSMTSLISVGIALIITLSVAAIIYANTGNRFRKEI